MLTTVSIAIPGAAAPATAVPPSLRPAVCSAHESGCLFVPRRDVGSVSEEQREHSGCERMAFRVFLVQLWREDTFISTCSVGTRRGRAMSMAFSREIRNQTAEAKPPWSANSEVSRWESPTVSENRQGRRRGGKWLLLGTYPMALGHHCRDSALTLLLTATREADIVSIFSPLSHPSAPTYLRAPHSLQPVS